VTGALALVLAAALGATTLPFTPRPRPRAKPAGHKDSGFALTIAGGIATLPLDWTTTASWTLYAEPARLEASQEASLGPAVEGALSFRFARRFGVSAAFGWSRRDGSAEIEAQLPHPLYLGRPRTVSGSASSLEYSQTASHLDFEWRPVTGKLELALFAGPTLLRAKAELVDRVTATEAYPYDTASFASATATSVSSSDAFGWNVGAALGAAVASHVDLGVQLRYSRAKPELTTSSGSVTLEAGGLDVTGFVRFGF